MHARKQNIKPCVLHVRFNIYIFIIAIYNCMDDVFISNFFISGVAFFIISALSHFCFQYSCLLLLNTGVLVSPQPDQEGNKLQRQKILMFMYPIYNHNWRNSNTIYTYNSGPGSVVGIATAYGLEGPEIESRWGRDFPHLSKPDLRPTQPSVKCAPGLSRG